MLPAATVLFLFVTLLLIVAPVKLAFPVESSRFTVLMVWEITVSVPFGGVGHLLVLVIFGSSPNYIAWT